MTKIGRKTGEGDKAAAGGFRRLRVAERLLILRFISRRVGGM